MSDTTQNIPPGWYPDPNAPGGQRWWDGADWTEHTGTDQPQASQPLAPQKAPEGTKTGTVWIWILALSPLLSLISLFLVDWKAQIDATLPTSLGSPASPYGQLAAYSEPGYLISSALGWVFFAATVVFAALDWRELRKRGIPQPFHWAFAFLPLPVYVIGRSVVARRRAGGGMAPLWVYIATFAVVFIAYIILMVLLVNYMVQAMSLLTSSY